jgi:hypothetical protein
VLKTNGKTARRKTRSAFAVIPTPTVMIRSGASAMRGLA